MQPALPLFIVTGTSGAGKTAVIPDLRRRLPEFDVFDMDSLQSDNWEQVKCNWLRIAAQIAASGRGTVICGTIVPENLQRCDCLNRFSKICYINLHADDETRAARLRTRPWVTDQFIEDHRNFAGWLLANAATAFDPPMPAVDTSHRSVTEVAGEIAAWVRANWE